MLFVIYISTYIPYYYSYIKVINHLHSNKKKGVNFLLLSQTKNEFNKTNNNFSKNVSIVLVKQRESC